MTTATLTLTDFLLARIEEDEAEAQAAAETFGSDGDWIVEEGRSDCGYTVRNRGSRWELTDGGDFAVSQAEHIARWDPARVLVECAGKRAIVEQFCGAEEMDSGNYAYGAQHSLETVLRLLARPYADHPDYREDWRP